MATTPGKPSKLPVRHISSEDFVESCGAILFDLADPKDLSVCLIRTRVKQEWLLAKGRRNYGESRHEAAIREVMEETGFRCHLFPVTMPTRATPPEAPAIFPDQARIFDNLTEPFTCEIREYKRPKRTKLIWWYIAARDQDIEGAEKLPGEANYEPHFVPIAEALNKITYEADRNLVARAARLVSHTLKVPFDYYGMVNSGNASSSVLKEGDLPNATATTAQDSNPEPREANKRSRRKSKNDTSEEVAAPTRLSKRQRRSANKALASIGNAQTSTATPASDEVASQPDSAKSQASNTGSKKRPQNGTPEELMAFKQSKSERMKAKRAARNKEQS